MRANGRLWSVVCYGDEPPVFLDDDDADDGWGPDVVPERCGDCGVHRGGHHHPGCDLALLPVLRRPADQLRLLGWPHRH